VGRARLFVGELSEHRKARMKKRNLFEELMEGFNDLERARRGEVVLRTTTVPIPDKHPSIITAAEIVAVRKRLKLSKSSMARYLRTNPHTLKKWEKGVKHQIFRSFS